MVKKILLSVLMGCLLGSMGVFASGKTETTEKAAAPAGKESPMLARLVAEGKLPPLDQRLPENPHVVPVVEEIGQYGGTLYGVGIGFNGIRDTRQMIGIDKVLYVGKQGIEPGYAEFELSSDGKVLTLYFRKGMKWPDGEPFTVDGMLFWYEDMLLAPEITKAVSPNYKPGGQVFEMAKVDDYTVR